MRQVLCPILVERDDKMEPLQPHPSSKMPDRIAPRRSRRSSAACHRPRSVLRSYAIAPMAPGTAGSSSSTRTSSSGLSSFSESSRAAPDPREESWTNAGSYCWARRDTPGSECSGSCSPRGEHPVHRAKLVSAWVGRHAERIELHVLPGSSPELNPVELLNQDVKANAAGRRRARSAAELSSQLRSYLRRRQRQSEVVARFFVHPHTCYAAQ
jgi:hypothetical protein